MWNRRSRVDYRTFKTKVTSALIKSGFQVILMVIVKAVAKEKFGKDIVQLIISSVNSILRFHTDESGSPGIKALAMNVAVQEIANTFLTQIASISVDLLGSLYRLRAPPHQQLHPIRVILNNFLTDLVELIGSIVSGSIITFSIIYMCLKLEIQCLDQSGKPTILWRTILCVPYLYTKLKLQT